MLQLWLLRAFFRMDDKRWKKVRVSGTNLRTLWKEVGVKYMWLRFPGTKLILLVVEFSMGVHHRPIGAMVTYHRSSLLRGVSRYSFGSWHIRSWCIFIARIAHLPVVWFSPVSAGLFKAAAEKVDVWDNSDCLWIVEKEIHQKTSCVWAGCWCCI